MDEKIKWLCSVLIGGLCAFSKQYGILIALVIVVIAFDTITGLIKAKATDEGLQSGKGTKGFFKKIALLLGLFFGFLLDYAIPIFLLKVNIGLTFNLPFGFMIGFYIFINEGISICENLYAINHDILPEWIKKFLKIAKNQINKQEVDGVDNNEDTVKK